MTLTTVQIINTQRIASLAAMQDRMEQKYGQFNKVIWHP